MSNNEETQSVVEAADALPEPERRELSDEEKAKHRAHAKQLEQEMLDEAAKRAQDPTEVAATIYHMYLPKFKAGMKKLGVKARDRVWMHILEYPLNDKPHDPPTQLEKELFYLGHSLMEAKWVMVVDTVRSGLQQLHDKAESPLTEEEMKGIVEEFGFEKANEQTNEE